MCNLHRIFIGGRIRFTARSHSTIKNHRITAWQWYFRDKSGDIDAFLLAVWWRNSGEVRLTLELPGQKIQRLAHRCEDNTENAVLHFISMHCELIRIVNNLRRVDGRISAEERDDFRGRFSK